MKIILFIAFLVASQFSQGADKFTCEEIGRMYNGQVCRINHDTEKMTLITSTSRKSCTFQIIASSNRTLRLTQEHVNKLNQLIAVDDGTTKFVKALGFDVFEIFKKGTVFNTEGIFIRPTYTFGFVHHHTIRTRNGETLKSVFEEIFKDSDFVGIRGLESCIQAE